MKRALIAGLLLGTAVLQAQVVGPLGQQIKWMQIMDPPDFLLTPVELTKGPIPVAGGAIVKLGTNRYRIDFPEGGGGDGDGDGGSTSTTGPSTLNISVTTAVDAGTVAPWAGPAQNLPVGWLACDGQLVGTNEYPELYAVLGRTYTPLGASANVFAVPDYRGAVLEGVQPTVLGADEFPTGYVADTRVGPPVNTLDTRGVGSYNPSFRYLRAAQGEGQASTAHTKAVTWMIKASTNPHNAVTAGAVTYGDDWSLENSNGVLLLTVNTNDFGGVAPSAPSGTVVSTPDHLGNRFGGNKELSYASTVLQVGTSAGVFLNRGPCFVTDYPRFFTLDSYLGVPGGVGGAMYPRYLRVRVWMRDTIMSGQAETLIHGSGYQYKFDFGSRGIGVPVSFVLPAGCDARIEWWISAPQGSESPVPDLQFHSYVYEVPLIYALGD